MEYLPSSKSETSLQSLLSLEVVNMTVETHILKRHATTSFETIGRRKRGKIKNWDTTEAIDLVQQHEGRQNASDSRLQGT